MASPDTKNYYIGKGVVYAKMLDVTPPQGFRHIGNVPEFEVTPEVEELEHYSSMAGVRTRDRTVVLEKSMTLRMVMEEFTLENLAMALLGEQKSVGGYNVIDIFERTKSRYEIKLIGTNDVGARFMWHFPAVDFIPASSVNAITEEWGTLEVTGEVAQLNSSTPFGRLTLLAAEDETVSESVSELLAIGIT